MEHLWVERQAAVTVIHFGVEYGSCSWAKLEQTEESVLRLAENADPPRLLIDLTNTDYFGSAFLNVLVGCYQRVKRRRGRFSLCGVQPDLMRELEVTRLTELWPVYATRQQALEAERDGGHK